MIPYDLTLIQAIIFDVDGVLSTATIAMDDEGEPRRTMNVKDGYAIQQAIKAGLRIAIMTGGRSENIVRRYEYLGVTDIYIGCHMKMDTYREFKEKYGLSDKEVLYMGDDIPDLEVMRVVGCPVCPADACTEIKQASLYISQHTGGNGCCRDILEQVLRSKHLWLHNQEAFGW